MNFLAGIINQMICNSFVVSIKYILDVNYIPL